MDVSSVRGDASSYQVYVVDALGNATLLGMLSISDNSGSLTTDTPLSKFMIVISSESDLTTIDSETKVTLPSGFNMAAKEGIPDEKMPSPPEPVASNSQMEKTADETSDYDVPLLDIGSMRRGADTSMRTVFSASYEDRYASVIVRLQKKGPTQVKLRLERIIAGKKNEVS